MNKYFLLLSLLVTACAGPVQQSNSDESAYFDMPSFVEKQVAQLAMQQASVIKRQEVNQKLEEINQSTINWAKELSLFSEANINKPVLKGAYEVTTDQNTTIYQSINDDNKVRKLQVTKAGDAVNKIQIQWVDDNPIYHSTKKMIMQLSNDKLSSYAIHGYQKMVGNDTLFYNLDAQVKY